MTDLRDNDELVWVRDPGPVAPVTRHPVPRIVTAAVFPPIPVRSFDWCAHFDGDEESGVYGYGATEAEARLDFIENYATDRHARIFGQVS